MQKCKKIFSHHYKASELNILTKTIIEGYKCYNEKILIILSAIKNEIKQIETMMRI